MYIYKVKSRDLLIKVVTWESRIFIGPYFKNSRLYMNIYIRVTFKFQQHKIKYFKNINEKISYITCRNNACEKNCLKERECIMLVDSIYYVSF